MIYETEKFTNELIRLKITPNQCHIIMIFLETGKKRDELVNKFNISFGFNASDIAKLEELGYLENMNSQKPNAKQSIHLYIITPKLKELLFIDEDDLEIACEEAWLAYPKLLTIDGKSQSSRTISRTDFTTVYSKIIKGNIILHKKIVEMFTHYKGLVKKGKVHGLGLKKALETRIWEVIEEMIEQEEEEKEQIFGKER